MITELETPERPEATALPQRSKPAAFRPVRRSAFRPTVAAMASIAATALLFTVTAALGQAGRLVVHVDQPGARISPMFTGLMTEEINHSYDGGLYAELIRNRAFKDSRARPVAWSVVQERGGVGTADLDETHPI